MLVHPLALCTGERLFDEGSSIPFRLLSAQPFTTGVVHLVYSPQDDAPTGDYNDAKAHLPQ
ncbi:hypothetical protein OHA42_22905 [Nocardia sp. NBC_01009]|nr:hypothetical protein OHA42_22905 [Nocardia sp. NBC_01009]